MKRWAGHLSCIVVMGLAPCLSAQAEPQVVPAFAEVRTAHVSSTARLVDRYGEPLAERQLRFEDDRLDWVALDALSPAMVEALLEAEDRRFYQHEGIDWRAVAAAAVQNLWFEHARGASTLSMQLAGLLDPALQPASRGHRRRTLEQKWDQALAAQALEARWSKAQILEAYLNLAPFRGRLRGISAAAWALAGKTPDALERPEAAVLAALLRGPGASPAVLIRRACALVARIGSPAGCEQVKAMAAAMDPVLLTPRWTLAPHLAARLLREPGANVATLLDARWQRRMQAALQAAAPARAAVVVIDNATGAVLADIGGLSAAHADATAFTYPAGSMLWPLQCARAIDRRGVTAASLLNGDGDGEAPQWLSLRRAAAEENTRAMAELIRHQAEADGPALPLSAQALDLPRLAALTRLLATDGHWRAPAWLPGAERAATPVVSAGAAFIGRDLFDPVMAQMVTPGRAAWATGANAEVSIAVWMETGPTALIEVRAWLADQLAADGPWPAERVVPAGVLRRPVRFDPPVEPARDEWFLAGTAVPVVTPPQLSARIAAPAARAIIDLRALPAGQGVLLRASIDDPRLRWRLDGREVGSGGTAVVIPQPGLRVIELVDARGERLDRISVAVRGR
ncbi:transglycosylase domain-containing protein [Denitromonas iodatirespirans]|uniref:peptidoglycan glycosyltransferase n=1 Tax=Denitromonas iodatirespirans TaxID=2795389 RepID=A0A944DF56_DENI1|nr:transglycosylase domain-containing protein [Denitromonas iodatirespirans]MBT0963137.1 transglycosylase domain-containing protein [Denitromonas iodatirespirans]